MYTRISHFQAKVLKPSSWILVEMKVLHFDFFIRGKKRHQYLKHIKKLKKNSCNLKLYSAQCVSLCLKFRNPVYFAQEANFVSNKITYQLIIFR